MKSRRIIKVFMLVIMIANGLFFISNIYALSSVETAIAMHEDLVPDAGPVWAYAKVINVFITGLLYLISAGGIIKKKYTLCIAGIAGLMVFWGMYIVQLILWANRHPETWISFGIFGSVSLLIGLYSWIQWKKRLVTDEKE